MKDLGTVEFLLGMEIKLQPNGDIYLLQEKYLGNVLAKFDMQECQSVSTPLLLASKLSQQDSPQNEADWEAMTYVPYRQALGSVMYLATCSRPDIFAAYNSLCRFSADTGPAHWEGIHHVLKYLKGTNDGGISYKRGASTEIWEFNDASHLTCPDTGKSRAELAFSRPSSKLDVRRLGPFPIIG